MKVTIDGITYEGAEEEIRRIVENPPRRPPVDFTRAESWTWPPRPHPQNWDDSPADTCAAEKGDAK